MLFDVIDEPAGFVDGNVLDGSRRRIDLENIVGFNFLDGVTENDAATAEQSPFLMSKKFYPSEPCCLT